MKRSSKLLLGPYLLNLAKSSMARGDTEKALDYATQAVQFLSERSSLAAGSIEVAIGLRIVADALSKLDDHENALEVLQGLEWLLMQKKHHHDDKAVQLALAYGYMQLGDLLATSGQHRRSLQAYHCALEAEKQALGKMSPRVAEMLRFLAELHLQALEVEEAKLLCEELLKMHCHEGHEVQELEDRRLMAIVQIARGDLGGALEQLMVVSECCSNSPPSEVASIQACIQDVLAALGHEYQALSAYKASARSGNAAPAALSTTQLV